MTEARIEQKEPAAENTVLPETAWQRRGRILKQHLWGPTGSILLHILVVAALIKLATTVRPPPLIPVTVERTDWDKVDRDPRPDDFKDEDPMKHPENSKPLEAPKIRPAQEEPIESSVIPQFQVPPIEFKVNVTLPSGLFHPYTERTAQKRKGAETGEGNPHGPKAAAAVRKALDWLRDCQEPDGSWVGGGAADNRPAMTGLALLTFLAHDEKTDSKAYGVTVEKAIRWLLRAQKINGAFDDNAYAHAIALYAISEGYAMCRIPEMREAMEKGARRVMEGMQPSGGFTYGYAQDGRRDTSVTGWQAQALKAAYIARAEVDALPEALERIAHGLKMNYDPARAMFLYAPPTSPEANRNVTAIGALCLQMLGHGADKECLAAVQGLRDFPCDWDRPPRRGLYGWYYVTQVRFHDGGSSWTSWNDRFAPMFIARQNHDGSWTPSDQEEEPYGPVYGTTLSALTLMVYYRNGLPTYRKIDTATPGQPGNTEADIQIEIL